MPTPSPVGPCPGEAQLLVAVELGLDAPPVVVVAPRGAQLLHVGQRDALRPVVDGLPLGHRVRREPVPQVVEDLVGDGDGCGRELAVR